jgi:hypothetical protein
VEFKVTVEGPYGSVTKIIPAELVDSFKGGPKDLLARAARMASLEIEADR